jgi:uncharacterized OB-fold protein
LSPDHEWLPASGDGRLFTFAVVHRALDPYWKGELPYVVAVIELAEGPRLLSNLVETELDHIEIGMPLRVVFEPLTDDIVVPRFKACPK